MATTIENARSKRLEKEGQQILLETGVLLASAQDDLIEGYTDCLDKQMGLYDLRPTELRAKVITDLIINREKAYQERDRIRSQLYH